MTAAPPCAAVCAMPLFVAQRLLPDIRAYGYDPAVHAARAAWMVSNFVMDGYPLEAPGEPLSWDNVVYQGQGLGCGLHAPAAAGGAVAAQRVHRLPCLSRLEPADARRWLSQASPEALRDEAAADLIAAYGEEFWRARAGWITVRGHAMATPHCGSLSNAGLAALLDVDGQILFAHADLSGYSVFEEAAWWGVTAAARIRARAPPPEKKKPAARLVQAGGGLDATASVFSPATRRPTRRARVEHGQQVRHVHAAALVAGHVQHHLPLVQHDRALAHVQRLAHAVRHHHGGELAFGDDAPSAATRNRRCGSSAAVCSSSSRMRDGCSAAISRLTAWRWPPDNRPISARVVFQAQAQRRQPLAKPSRASRP